MFKATTLALALMAAPVSFASAQSHFTLFDRKQNRDTRIELGLVRADRDGVVEIYDYHRNQVGTRLGSTRVHAGANSHVNVRIRRTGHDIIAILRIDGRVADTHPIELD